MKEDLLHYFWRIKKWGGFMLETTDGVSCEILNSGNHNTNAGPDFLNAKIKLGGTTWSGNIEMHLLSSDWLVHNHQTDNVYDSVILHVVWKHDKEINYTDKSIIPCIELSKYISPRILYQYESLQNNSSWIPCENLLAGTDKLKLDTWLSRMLVEKFEEKYALITKLLDKNTGDWEETFHQWLAKGFGLNINAQPFEMLAMQLPLKLLAKLKDQPLQLEAIVFGQGGLLPDTTENSYIASLKSEYQYLQKKYSLIPLEKGVFKFFRVRPPNFPVLRVAQWIAFLKDNLYSWQHVKEMNTPKGFIKALRRDLSGYWEDHYTFDPTIIKAGNKAGEDFASLIIINVVAPFLYAYGKKNNDITYQEKGIDFIDQLKPETNNIISKWQELGVKANTAGHTQGLLYLKKNYCDYKKCMQCAIGHIIMNK